MRGIVFVARHCVGVFVSQLGWYRRVLLYIHIYFLRRTIVHKVGSRYMQWCRPQLAVL